MSRRSTIDFGIDLGTTHSTIALWTGTAIMQVRDGVIQVVNHAGDNQVGGKLIDRAIVDEVLIPAVTRQYRLTDFRRGNPKYQGAIGKLKHWAEHANIQMSRNDSAAININFLCNDDQNTPVRFDYDLKRADVERLAEPFIRRSINICKKVLGGEAEPGQHRKNGACRRDNAPAKLKSLLR